MATLTIRDLDDNVRDNLRVLAAQHGRSMEAEVRAILSAAVRRPASTVGLATRLHRRFGLAGLGVDLDLPERTEFQRPVVFE